MEATMDYASTSLPLAPESAETVDPFCALFPSIFIGGVGSTLGLLGIIGNGITLVILWKERAKSATFFLMFSLVATDTIILSINLPFSIPISIPPGTNKQILKVHNNIRTLAHVYIGHTMDTLHIIKTYLTVLVTLHRFIKVCLPFKDKRWGTMSIAKKQMVGVIIGAVLYQVPIYFKRSLEITPDGMYIINYNQKILSNFMYSTFYGIILYHIVVYAVPIVTLLVLSVGLMIEMSRVSKKRGEMLGQVALQKSLENQNAITKTLITVDLVFMVCTVMQPIRQILLVIFPPPIRCRTTVFYFNAAVVTAKQLSSAVNLVIYILFVKRFRDQLVAIMKRSSKIGPKSDLFTAPAPTATRDVK